MTGVPDPCQVDRSRRGIDEDWRGECFLAAGLSPSRPGRFERAPWQCGGTQGAQDTVKRRQPVSSHGRRRRRLSRGQGAFPLVGGQQLLVPLQRLIPELGDQLGDDERKQRRTFMDCGGPSG